MSSVARFPTKLKCALSNADDCSLCLVAAATECTRYTVYRRIDTDSLYVWCDTTKCHRDIIRLDFPPIVVAFEKLMASKRTLAPNAAASGLKSNRVFASLAQNWRVSDSAHRPRFVWLSRKKSMSNRSLVDEPNAGNAPFFPFVQWNVNAQCAPTRMHNIVRPPNIRIASDKRVFVKCPESKRNPAEINNFLCAFYFICLYT